MVDRKSRQAIDARNLLNPINNNSCLKINNNNNNSHRSSVSLSSTDSRINSAIAKKSDEKTGPKCTQDFGSSKKDGLETSSVLMINRDLKANGRAKSHNDLFAVRVFRIQN